MAFVFDDKVRSEPDAPSNIPVTNNNIEIYFKSKYRSRYGIADSNGNAILDIYDDFVTSNLISDISISKQFKNYTLTVGSDNLFDYTDPENIPNYPGRVIYSKLNFKL